MGGITVNCATGRRTGKRRGPGDFPEQLIMSAQPLTHTHTFVQRHPPFHQPKSHDCKVKSQRSQWEWHPPALCSVQPAQPHLEAELTAGMGSENASSSRESSDLGQESQTTGLESSATSWLCGLRPANPLSGPLCLLGMTTVPATQGW